MKRIFRKRRLPPTATLEDKSCATKKQYANEVMARMGAMRWVLRGNVHSGKLWVYPCRFCTGWHITSRPSGHGGPVTVEGVGT